jgi:DNA-binding transcriptional ArsR family regulator
MQAAATLDRTFHALSDPTRRAMVQRLARGPASVSELARPLSISLPAVMQHLQVLEASGCFGRLQRGLDLRVEVSFCRCLLREHAINVEHGNDFERHNDFTCGQFHNTST